MDWQKYPKSSTSIRIRQPETLDSIKCHTFPGMGGRILEDILMHDSTLQKTIVPKVLIEPAHLNSSSVETAENRPNDWIGGSCYRNKGMSRTQTAQGTGMVKVVPSRQFTGVAVVPRRHLSTGPPYRPPTYRPPTAGHLRYIHAYAWYM